MNRASQIVTDPKTGVTSTKTKLGGAYPGQRRPQHQSYVPPASDFGPDGKATVHFIAHGGGNALTLVRKDGTYQPQAGASQGGVSQHIEGMCKIMVKNNLCLSSFYAFF
jgi:hypothetical protein